MGYHLLIVDDDMKTRNGLRKHINWEALGIAEIQMAESAQQAFEILEMFPCDIVLSDIRMRGMDGIEMSQRLKERMPLCQIVFISAYSDKEYLKAAIELGAAAYVEKPIRPSEIVRAISMAIHIIEQNNKLCMEGTQALEHDVRYYNSKLLFALAERTLPYESIADKVADSLLLSQSHPAMRMCIIRLSAAKPDMEMCRSKLEMFFEKARGVQPVHIYFEFKDPRNILALFSGEEEPLADGGKVLRRMQSLMKYCVIDNSRMFIAVGQMVRDPSLLYLSYSTARAAMKRLFTLDYGVLAFPSSNIRGPLSAESQRAIQMEFERGIALLDGQRIENALEQLKQLLVENDAVFDVFVKNLYYGLALRLAGEWRGSALSGDLENDIALAEMETLKEVHQYLIRRVHQYIADMKENANDTCTINKVMKIIQTEYTNPELSISMLSARVYLAPSYLSELFKRKTGKTIVQSITDIRMKQTKVLLLDNHYNLTQIAKMVGYNDPDYHARVFKKHTGMTLSSYRKQVLSQ